MPPQHKGKGLLKRESSPLSDLELGISSYGGGLRSVVKQEEDQFAFTASQFQELNLQFVIFRYILSGLPVPFGLVLPIWNSVSVACSLSSAKAKSEIYRYFPSLFGGFDYRSLMDPEPGRCRRTDGKKWRCYKDVVPNQKYCERHMHRGSQRSRKHVETSEGASNSKQSTINSYNYAPSVISSSAAATESGMETEISTSHNLTVPCFNARQRLPGTFKDGSSSYADNCIWKCKGKNIVGDRNRTDTSSLVGVVAEKNNTRYESNYSSGKGMNFNHIYTTQIDRINVGNKNYTGSSVAPVFGLSPKSVLQHGNDNVCTALNLEWKTPEETEPLRCRRSDGKRWRCKRHVVPNKKYCETHLCRGSKKATLESKLVIGAPVSLPPHIIQNSCTKPAKTDNSINLNTDLSISMAANPQGTSNNGCASSLSSSSDATTLTDENASISHNLTRSP